MKSSPTGTNFFSLEFGGANGAGHRFAAPVLAGFPRETLFGDLRFAGGEDGFELFESRDWLVGLRSEPAGGRLGEITDAIYGDLLGVVRRQGRELTRVWNFVPQINAQTAEGLEAYRVFCRGRALAF